MTRDTDEVSHLRTQKWIMLATGQWEFEKYDKPLLFLYRFYSRFIFWYSLYYMLVSMASTYLYWDCDKRMIELIMCVGLSTDNLLVMILSKYYNLEKILKRILDFEKALQQDQVEEREIYYKRARLNNKLNWLIISCMGFCVAYFYIEAMSDILYLPFSTCILVYKITVILSMITFTLGQIDILHYNIRNLDNDAGKIQKELDVNFKEAVEIVVKRFVVKHQELNQLMEMIQSSTKVLVLLLYFNMSAQIAILCIKCLLVKSFEEIRLHTSMVVTMTIQNFVFYKYADDLITESAAISDVIYNNTNWISYSRTVQKNLQLMMIRSRKSLSLNAAMVGDMTLETFTKFGAIEVFKMSKNKNEIPHLRTQKLLMLVAGQWEFEKYDKPLLFLYRFYSISMLCYFLYTTLVIVASTYMYRDCKSRLTEYIMCFAMFMDNFLVVILSKSYDLKRILNRILEFERTQLQEADAEERRMHYNRAKLNNKINLLVISCVVYCAIYYYIDAVRNSFKLVETEACPVTKLAMYQTWHVSKNYFVVVLSDVLTMPYSTSIVAFRITIILSMLTFVLGQIDILHHNVRNLDREAEKLRKELGLSFEEAMEVVVKRCFVKHQELNGLMKMIRKSTSAFVLLLYFNMSAEITAMWILCLLEKSTGRLFLNLCMVITMTIQNFVFYKFADDIITQSTAIADVIYNETKWTSYSKPVQKNLQLMMMRSNKGLSLNAAIVGDMTLETFTKLMKLCYTIVAFFKTTYGF
ncbi:hypothetical protein NQ315_006943 [Exocentrus adspersus]|uniref:Odorant receptor n=1 Tax=Exocentrus adspersus TaxID=1586481 RepID=A0AAV8WC45_9CUCU|nr:hypothetical protein NQ315_006943 [Exocentrus adspersus]